MKKIISILIAAISLVSCNFKKPDFNKNVKENNNRIEVIEVYTEGKGYNKIYLFSVDGKEYITTSNGGITRHTKPD